MAGICGTGIVESSDWLAHWQRRISASAGRAADGLRRYKYLVLFLFSILYLLATCYRASRKLFWLDELFTVYISRLPDLASVWNALKEGADFNPPLFYALTKFFESLAGEGPVATRLPEILGFWIFCLCLFRFVSIRTSVLAGLISMLFPLVTTAYFYAYEARAHGVLLGFCGIALISWQAAVRSRRKGWRLFGLFGALFCAILTHTYGLLLIIPFALAESVRYISLRRADWTVSLAIVSSSSAALFCLPLMRAAKTGIPTWFAPARGSALANSYQFHLAPAAGVLSAGLFLYFVFKYASSNLPDVAKSEQSLELPEVVVLIAFVLMPVFSFLLAKLTGAPIFGRYSISTIAGFACLFGIMAARRPPVGLAVLVLLVAQIGLNLFEYSKTAFITEPSSSLALTTTPDIFASWYQMMEAAPDKTLPIVLLDDLEFLPVMHYAPPGLVSRLIYVVPPVDDLTGEFYIHGQPMYRGPGRAERMASFLATHDTFLVHSSTRSLYRLKYFIAEGAAVKVESTSMGGFLFSVRKHHGESATASLH